MTYVYLVYYLPTTSWWERLFDLPPKRKLYGILTSQERADEEAEVLERSEGVETTRVERWSLG
jgi:hypothetical protein